MLQHRLDIEHDFRPSYEVTKQKVVSDLRQAARAADEVYLATDPDREGEAIAWHITQAVDMRRKPVHRVVFQEITPNAVRQAMQSPRRIDRTPWQCPSLRTDTPGRPRAQQIVAICRMFRWAVLGSNQ